VLQRTAAVRLASRAVTWLGDDLDGQHNLPVAPAPATEVNDE
jgi:hypothetical protein